MSQPAAQAAPSAVMDITSLTFSGISLRLTVASALTAVMIFHDASAGANDQRGRACQVDGASEDESPESDDHLTAFYRRVALPPYLERRVQAILEAEWEEAQANAEKVGLRRMSRRHYRRALVALDRRTDAKIRALIGPKKFLAWNRARMDPMRNRAGRAALAARMQAGRPAPAPARAAWTRDQCAGLGRLLRGAALENTSVEEAHFWIHDLARHC